MSYSHRSDCFSTFSYSIVVVLVSSGMPRNFTDFVYFLTTYFYFYGNPCAERVFAEMLKMIEVFNILLITLIQHISVA